MLLLNKCNMHPALPSQTYTLSKNTKRNEEQKEKKKSVSENKIVAAQENKGKKTQQIP